MNLLDFNDCMGSILPIEFVAKRMRVTPETIRRWRRVGRQNPFTREMIRAQMTWMPNGGWGMTQAQFDRFIEELNQKP